MISIGLLFVVFILFILFYNFYFKRRNLPPGPTPLPIIGNLYSIYKEQPGEDCYIRWAKKYGQIYTFWLSEQPVVVLTDYAKIVETFQKDGDTYAGRSVFQEFQNLMNGGVYGVVLTEGEVWREHRRFALQVFRNFGLGKNLMQDKILNEIDSRFSELNAQIDAGVEEIEIAKIIDVAIGSIINSLLFGYRFEGEHLNEFFYLKNIAGNIIQKTGEVLNFIIQWKPLIFRHFPIFKKNYWELKDSFDIIHEFYRCQIKKHLEEIDLDNNENPTDYVEAYLKEKSRQERISGNDHLFSDNQLIQMCFDLWIAGQETTSTTLAWGVAYLIHNQDIQEKMQNEIDSVFKTTDSHITVNDRSNLPYTSAVVNEILRIANLVPINVLHRTTKDVTIDGYFLPKGTTIIPQVSAILYDEKYFFNPKEFNPNRFLDSDGNLKKTDELIPFSIGKRQCLGESLARMELFLFVVNLFNQYKILPGKEMPSLKRKIGVTVSCPRYQCKIIRRCKY